MEKNDRKRDPRIVPPGLEVRLAKKEDIPALVAFGRAFFAESQYGLFGVEFSERVAEAYLTEAVSETFVPHLVATIDGLPVGGVSFSYDNSFSERPIAVLQNIYVEKKFRRSAIGRILIMMAADLAKSEGACAFFAPVNSGTGNTHSLGNMLLKGGFDMTGYITTRRL